MKNSTLKSLVIRANSVRGGGKIAFTMAEILLSLTIIGVVAAITLPSLTGNINERTWNTQRKALYARFSQALALMPSLNGYGTLIEVPAANTFGLSLGGSNSGAESKELIDTAAETFITAGLSKVFKMNNICDNEHFSDCGFPSKITPMSRNETIDYIPKKLSELNPGMVEEPASEIIDYEYIEPVKILDSKAASFETQNGESIAVYYNPHCTGFTPEKKDQQWIWQEAGPLVCANFIYDLNGKKGPNTVGKDIGFITAFYPTDPIIVAPMPVVQDISELKTHIEAGKACKNIDSESRLPNINELTAIALNNRILGINSGRGIWSSTLISSGHANGQAWQQRFEMIRLERSSAERNNTLKVKCIKR